MVAWSSRSSPAGEPNLDTNLVFVAGCRGLSKWKVASAIAAVTGDNPADVRVFFKTDRDLRRVKLPSAASVRAALDEEEVLCDGQEIRINPWDPKPSRGEAASRDSSPSSDERPASGTQTDLRDADMQQHSIRLHGLACMLKDLSEVIMSRERPQ